MVAFSSSAAMAETDATTGRLVSGPLYATCKVERVSSLCRFSLSTHTAYTYKYQQLTHQVIISGHIYFS